MANEQKSQSDLDAALKELSNGYFLLFDIRESTQRKLDYPALWAPTTQALYEKFSAWCLNVVHKLNENRNDAAKWTIVQKLLGDGMIVFFQSPDDYGSKQTNASSNNKMSLLILSRIDEFLSTVNEDQRLCGMRLKTVVTWLTSIRKVEIRSEGNFHNDVLGRGIDFCFRLEQFADSTHIICNEMFLSSLTPSHQCREHGNLGSTSNHSEDGSDDDTNNRNRNSVWGYHKASRIVKGWQGPQSFYILYKKVGFSDNLKDLKPSFEDRDVRSELLSILVMLKNSDLNYNLQETVSEFKQKGE